MIQQIISEIVSQLQVEGSTDSPTFIHGWKGWQNLVADEIKNNIVFLDEPITSNDTISGAYLQETYSLTLAFLEKNELDDTPDIILPVVDRQRIQRNKFVYLLRKNENIRGVEGIRTTDLFNVFDVNLSGVSLNITVTIINNTPIC